MGAVDSIVIVEDPCDGFGARRLKPPLDGVYWEAVQRLGWGCLVDVRETVRGGGREEGVFELGSGAWQIGGVRRWDLLFY